MRAVRVFALSLALIPATVAPLSAQDTLQLSGLQREAIERDPRAAQYALLERQAELRMRNLSAERLPQLSATGEATYQSEVTRIPIAVPGGEAPEPPKDRLEVALLADWLFYDGGGVASRSDVERARLAAARAQLAAELEPVRAEVNRSFFSALALQEHARETSALIVDLEARLEEVRAAVAEGAALPGDTAAVLAELLTAVERRRALESDRAAAFAVLAHLTATEMDEATVLQVPSLTDAVARTRSLAASSATLRAHPQFEAFAARRAHLAEQAAALRARNRPQASAFGRAAYGSPGYEQFTDELHDYWMGGVRVRWAPFDWGRTSRERELLDLERTVVGTEEAAFAERLLRESEQPLSTIDRLGSTLSTDDRIIALREQVVRQTRAQLDEGAITAAVHVDALSDLEQARVARALHRVQLAEAQAAYLTMLGIPLH
ncbi:MAG TPA: TolC family protein [Longimicrobiales bacterium]